MGRRKSKKRGADTAQVAERAAELREQAKEFAGTGGEALKEFADTTGVAARTFARTAYEAAKELLETVEHAGERMESRNKPKKKRGRKLLKATIVAGVAVAVVTNQKVRGRITGMLGRSNGTQGWETPPGDGELHQTPASQTTP